MATDTSGSGKPVDVLKITPPDVKEVDKTSAELSKNIKDFLSLIGKSQTALLPKELEQTIEKWTTDAVAGTTSAVGKEIVSIISGALTAILGTGFELADGVAFVLGMLKAVEAYGSQIANKETGYTLLAPVELAELYRRKDIDPDYLIEQLSRHGYNSKNIDKIETLSFNLLTQGEILDSWLRGYVNETDTTKKLEQHGFYGEQAARKLQLSQRVPELNDTILMRWFNIINDNEFTKQAFSQGFNPSLAARIKDIRQWIPSPVEALINARHGAFDQGAIDKWGLHDLLPDAFVPQMQRKGLTPDTALQYWAGHWSPLSNALATRLYQRRELSESELNEIYHLNGLAHGAWELQKEAEYNVPEYFVIEAMIAAKTFTNEKLTTLVLDAGYKPDIASELVAAFMAKEQSTQNNKLQTAIENQYKTGGVNQTEAEQALANVGLSSNQIAQVIQRIEVDIQIQSTEELLKVVRHDYVEKFINEEQAVTQMLSQGFNSKQVDYYIGLWRNERKLYKKRLTEAQVGHLYKKGKLTRPDAVERWVGMGYTQTDAELLIEYYT